MVRRRADSSARSLGGIRLVPVRNSGDLDLAAELMLSAHEESRYSSSVFNGGRFRRYHEATTLRDTDRYAMAIAFLGQRPVGQLTVACSYLYWADRRVAVVGHAYVVPGHRRSLAGGRTFRRLIEWANDWARARRIDEVEFSVNAGVRVEAVSSALERLGFRPVGGNFALPLA